MAANAPQQFVRKLRKLEPEFTVHEVRSSFADLKPSTVAVYLSQAKRAGQIIQTGRGTYRVHEANAVAETPRGMLGLLTERVRKSMTKRAYSQIVVWTDEDLAQFSHDAFMDRFFVIECSGAYLGGIQAALHDEFRVITVKSHRTLGAALWQEVELYDRRAAVFLLQNSNTRGTDRTKYGFLAPKHGRLLVNLLYMPPLLPEAAHALLGSPGFALRDFLDASPSKKIALAGGLLLGQMKPELEKRILDELERELPEGVT